MDPKTLQYGPMDLTQKMEEKNWIVDFRRHMSTIWNRKNKMLLAKEKLWKGEEKQPEPLSSSFYLLPLNLVPATIPTTMHFTTMMTILIFWIAKTGLVLPTNVTSKFGSSNNFGESDNIGENRRFCFST